MQIIAPERCGIIVRKAARVHKKAERRFSLMVKSQASAVISHSFMLREPPTSLTRTSIWPWAATIRLNASSTGCSSVTSTTSVSGCFPWLLTVSAVRFRPSTSALSQIVPELTPVPGEAVIRKKHASAFFGTDLAAWLAFRRIDTLLIAGCTTSGCVRASVIDASAHNVRPIVMTDCVGDRALGPHEANLFDMGQKYADLMSTAELLAAVTTNAPPT